jgi:hypothetical protein
MERDARLQNLFYISSRVPSKGFRHPGSPHRARSWGDAPLLESLHPYLKVSGKWAPLRVPQRGPFGKRCSSPEPSST